MRNIESDVENGYIPKGCCEFRQFGSTKASTRLAFNPEAFARYIVEKSLAARVLFPTIRLPKDVLANGKVDA